MGRSSTTGRRVLLGSLALALATSVLTVDHAHAERGRSKRKRPRINAPSGWRGWPPSAAMNRQGAECLRQLEALGVHFRPARRRRRIATPVVVKDMNFGGVVLAPRFRKPPFPMDCHLALALAEFAPQLRALGVAQLRFSTIHEYRRVRLNGGTRNSLSRHSFGLAVDVFEFVTDDGTLWTVATDYAAGDGVLHAIENRTRADPHFRLLLTPGNDPASHADHYHFEANLPRPALTKAERRTKRARAKRRRRAKRHARAKRPPRSEPRASQPDQP